ncbi:MAG: PEP-CTERM sorting domain-containing protein [Fimbriimonadaceae bacterium]|nr:PEP-CTERM sorting domain-containing protein [Fimbriimonadaceae bacterium]
MKLNKAIVGLGLITVVAAAGAQSASSFKPVTLSGLTATETAPGKFSVSFASTGASMVYNGQTYQLRDVFGFYQVAKSGDFTAAQDKSKPSNWSFKSLSGNASVTGWSNNSKSNSLSAGETFNYEFKKLTTTSGAEVVTGYHVRVFGQLAGGSDTMYVHGVPPVAPVPEPASMAVLGLGLLAFRRKRRNA